MDTIPDPHYPRHHRFSRTETRSLVHFPPQNAKSNNSKHTMTKFIMNNAIKALSKRSFPWAGAQGRTGGKRLLAISPNSFPISISSQALTPMMIPLRPRFPPLLLPQDVSPPRITISGLLMNSEEPKAAPSSNALVVANAVSYTHLTLPTICSV